jgi:hypothetical protein
LRVIVAVAVPVEVAVQDLPDQSDQPDPIR